MCYPRIFWLFAIILFTPIDLIASSAERAQLGLQATDQKARYQIEEKGDSTYWCTVNATNHLKVATSVGKYIVVSSSPLISPPYRSTISA